VKNLIGNDGVVSDESAGDKSTLVRTNDIGKNGLKSIDYGFSDNFKGDITQGYRSEITRFHGVFCLRYKAYVSVVVGLEVAIMVKDIKSFPGDVITYDIPIGMVEFGWEAIRPRSS
jgi:hypothetical protein